MKTSLDYKECFEKYYKSLKALPIDIKKEEVEFHFESLADWSIFSSLEEVELWYQERTIREKMNINDIPLNECRGWISKDEKIYHESGEFFEIVGVRVTNTQDREVGHIGWDQPLVKQVGFDGGILGLIRKRFNGIPHYLVQAKAEPGNPNLVQISPTLQATFNNLKKAHGGRAPDYANFFEKPEENSGIILYKQWLSEDGGRLYNKRNLNMLVEVPEECHIVVKNESFIWVSLYQLKKCLYKDAWVSPHIRGIISHF